MNRVQRVVVPLAVGGVVLAAGILSSVTGMTPLEKRLSELQEEAHSLENMLDAKKMKAQATEVKVKKSATGLDAQRMSEDLAAAEMYFRPAFNWSDGDTYDRARESYVEDLGEDSVFVTEFMPENVRVDEYSYVDNGGLEGKGVDCRYEGMELYVVNVSGDDYRYLGFVEYASTGASQGEARGHAVVEFTSVGGSITDVSAWPLATG